MTPEQRKQVYRQLKPAERKLLDAGLKRADREGWLDMVRGPQDYFALAEGCVFDERFAAHVERFFEQGLVHATDRWAGEPFIPQPWQRDDLLRPLFGWRRPDAQGKPRRFRSVFVKIAKKNGKTTVCGGLILYQFVEPDPDRPDRLIESMEVYGASTSQEVASTLYREAKKLAQRSPAMKRLGFDVRDQARRIILPATNSFFRVLPSKATSTEGMIAGGVYLDEVHAMKSRKLYAALRWAGSSRRQPLFVEITTSGEDDAELLWYQRDRYSRRVLNGDVRDTSHLALLYEADKDAELDDVEQLRKANPSLGITINEQDLVRDARQAMGEGPRAVAEFKRYRMNIAVGAENGWLSPEQWDKGQAPFDIDLLREVPCNAGLDLAKVSDFTALTLLWSPLIDYSRNMPTAWLDMLGTKWHGALWLWLPRAAIEERTRMGDVSYQAWADAGLIEVTDGDTTDHQLVRKRINELAERFTIRKIGIDRNFDGWQFTQDLFNDDELPAVGIGQGWKSQDVPMQRIEAFVTEARLNFGGHPVMRWMVSNAIAKKNGANGCLSLDRARTADKVDGVASLINAMYLAEATPEEEGPPDSYRECPLIIV